MATAEITWDTFAYQMAAHTGKSPEQCMAEIEKHFDDMVAQHDELWAILTGQKEYLFRVGMTDTPIILYASRDRAEMAIADTRRWAGATAPVLTPVRAWSLPEGVIEQPKPKPSSLATMKSGNKRVAAGLCRACAKQRTHYAGLCDECQVKFRAYYRKWRAKKGLTCGAWEPNSWGGVKPRVPDPQPQHGARFVDITGQRFGRLVAMSSESREGVVYWTCKCDCGNTHVASGVNLRGGRVASCGCLRTEMLVERSVGNENWKKRVRKKIVPTETKVRCGGSEGVR